MVLNYLPCSFSFTVVVALPCSRCDTCNKFTYSKQVKHKRSILCGASSKMFKFRKHSPEICISALPSCLPVVQRSQRACFTAGFPLPSLRELLPCFPLGCAHPGGTHWGLETSHHVGAPLQEGQPMEPLVARVAAPATAHKVFT